MKNLQKRQKGFTLIEALVATSLFVVTVVASTGVYLNTLAIHRRTDATRKASENARYVTEYLSKEIRNGMINYSNAVASPCSTTISTASRTLGLVNRDGISLCFYLGDANGVLSTTGPNLWMVKGSLGPYKINSADVKINNLLFYVAPISDPYAVGSTVQPRVTITGEVQTVGGTTKVPIQTSISIPKYDVVAP
jgi:prepilin-type N-terminal cleavage/methylation domain-containing protein